MKCLFYRLWLIRILFCILFLLPVATVSAKDVPPISADFVPGKGLSSQILLAEQEQAWLDRRHIPFGNHDQAMGVRKDWPELTSVINKALLTMSEAEENEIRNRWLSVRYEYGTNVKQVWSWVAGAAVIFYLIVAGTVVWNRRLQREIDSRIRAEENLRESNAYLDTLFNYSNAPIIVWDSGFKITRFNKSFEVFTGRTADEFIGNDISILFPVDQIDRSMFLVKGTLAGKHWNAVEIPILHVNGTVSTILWNSATIFENDGTTPLATIAQGHDISKRKRVEDALYKSEHEFRMLAEAMPQIVWITRPDGWNIYFNQQWVEYTGLTLEESYGHGWNKPFHPDDQQRAWDAWQNATQNLSTYSLECRLRRADGVYTWWLIRGVPILDECGAVIKWFGTCTDIDEFKHAEEEKLVLEQQFQHTQKLESLGVLAGGIAHDFNNILAVILCNCSLLQNRPNMADELVPEIEVAAHRAADLCRQMLEYAGKARPVPSKVNMTALVTDMTKMLKATIGQNVIINLSPTKDIPLIKADASQLRQVVMNLIINAAEAIGEAQGGILVSLLQTEIGGENPPSKDHLGGVITPGKYICLEVTDSGCGMDEETKHRVFEPFYTTKFTGRGLGMLAVLGIIKAHNGALQLFSQPGQGSTFKVYLPAHGNETAKNDTLQQSAAPVPWQGSGTILLVEDEPQLMFIAKTLIQELGFTVIEALDGKEALEVYQKNASDITMVLTDLGMPVMDGYELIHELKKRAPELPIIISSGFGDCDITSRIAREDIAGLVSKPYNFEKLREVLKGIVEGMK